MASPLTGLWPVTVRPAPVTTEPPATTGTVVYGLGAVHSCRRAAGTDLAAVNALAGTAAGRLSVARASLVHQMTAPTIAITRAMAPAARRSPRVRRSGLITLSRRWWPCPSRPGWPCAADGAGGAARSDQPSRIRLQENRIQGQSQPRRDR